MQSSCNPHQQDQGYRETMESRMRLSVSLVEMHKIEDGLEQNIFTLKM